MARIAKPWYNRGKKCWMAWINGKQVRLAEGRNAKKQARDRLCELQLQASKNPSPDSAAQTVASVIEAYLEFGTAKLAATTLATKKFYLQSFAEQHGWRSIADAKAIHLTQWLHDHPEWASDWTQAHAVSIIQRPFNWAARQGMIPQNPFREVSVSEGAGRRALTAEEFQALLRASGGRAGTRPSAGARFRQILIFLWFSGARPCEAAKLRWSDVDLENAVIVLAEHKTARQQKKPKPRIIALHPVVVKLLQSIRRRDEGEIVFLGSRKTPWNKNSLGLRVRRAREKAGIATDAKLYGTRHAFGTRAITNGIDIKTLAELLGHTTTKMTEHYINLAKEHSHLVASARKVTGSRQAD